MRYLLAFLLVGCTSPLHDDECNLAINPGSASAEEMTVILDAIEEWNTSLDGMITFKPYIGQGDHEIRFIDKGKTSKKLATTQMKGDIAGFYHGHHFKIDIVLNRIHKEDDPARQLRHTILHELGHHMGLDHDSGKDDSIMEPAGYGYCLTHWDILRLKSLYDPRSDGHNLQPSCSPEEDPYLNNTEF